MRYQYDLPESMFDEYENPYELEREEDGLYGEFDLFDNDPELEGERRRSYRTRRSRSRPPGFSRRGVFRPPRPIPQPPKPHRPPVIIRRRRRPIRIVRDPTPVLLPPPWSEYVRWVQSTLNRILRLNLKVNGIMGPETRNAVRSFQSRKGLVADGIVGPETEKALISVRTKSIQPTGGTSRELMEAENFLDPGPEAEWEGEINRRSRNYVRWLQQSLNKIAGTRLAVDGIMGSRTRAAVRLFQQKRGLTIDGIPGPQTEGALMKLGAGSPPGAAAPQARWTSDHVKKLKFAIVTHAKNELKRWRNGRLKETHPSALGILQEYYREGVRRNISRSNLANPAWQGDHPWSAVFISYIMRKAGAGSIFRYSAGHACYVRAARDNRMLKNANPFKAFRTSEIRPEVGDLVCAQRAGSGVNYDNVRCGFKSHCDIVVAKSGNKLTLVGGNVNNSVYPKPLHTNSSGFIDNPRYFSVIRLMPTVIKRVQAGFGGFFHSIWPVSREMSQGDGHRHCREL